MFNAISAFDNIDRTKKYTRKSSVCIFIINIIIIIQVQKRRYTIDNTDPSEQ